MDCALSKQHIGCDKWVPVMDAEFGKVVPQASHTSVASLFKIEVALGHVFEAHVMYIESLLPRLWFLSRPKTLCPVRLLHD